MQLWSSAMQRLKPKDIKHTREQLLKEQNNLCAICKEHVMPNEAVLDHDHKSGYIRAVLHRGCNAFIGHMENNQLRNRISPARLHEILTNFEAYIKDLKPILHSTYRTPEERLERSKKRAKKRRQAKRG